MMIPQLSSAPHDPQCNVIIAEVEQTIATYLAFSAYTRTQTHTQIILYAHHVHHLSGPIRTKCQKNATQKCHSLIIHTDQNSASSSG